MPSRSRDERSSPRRGRGCRRTSEALSMRSSSSSSSSPSSSSSASFSVRLRVSGGPRRRRTLRALAGRIRHPGFKTWPAVTDERDGEESGERRGNSNSSPSPSWSPRGRLSTPWNISDIFGMGHRSQRRGGHCLNLSPRIEVCLLLTCIPSRGARRETFRGPQGREDRAPRPTLVTRVFYRTRRDEVRPSPRAYNAAETAR